MHKNRCASTKLQNFSDIESISLIYIYIPFLLTPKQNKRLEHNLSFPIDPSLSLSTQTKQAIKAQSLLSDRSISLSLSLHKQNKRSEHNLSFPIDPSLSLSLSLHKQNKRSERNLSFPIYPSLYSLTLSTSKLAYHSRLVVRFYTSWVRNQISSSL